MKPRAMRIVRISGHSVALAALVAVVYLLWIRPWHLTWGATSQEIASAMPEKT